MKVTEIKKEENAKIFRIANDNGMSALVSSYGAVLISLNVPDKTGAAADVVLGFDELRNYEVNSCFFGATVGRNGNRIANATFKIGDKVCTLYKNEGVNNLHSGPDGYEHRYWDSEILENGVKFTLNSPDGDQGFPGELKISVSYLLTEDNALELVYNGISNKDTIVNMTNHSYFNLAGHASGDAMDHYLQINADKYTPVIDSASIPTGELAPVKDTPFDFTTAKRIGDDIDKDFDQLKFTGGFDHNFVLDGKRDENGMICAAVLTEKTSGRRMSVYTDCCAVQFYAGNFVADNPQKGKGGTVYVKRAGICLETQFYPDAINQPNFPSPILKAGEEYNSKTVYRFDTI